MEAIHFATTNQRKIDDLFEHLARHDISIMPLKTELDEIQSLDVLEVAKSKLDSAIQKNPDQRLLVDDRGFYISALNGFPGAYIKPFLDSLSVADILTIMKDKEDRTAKFVTVLGYFDGTEKHFFIEEETGFLSETERGDNLRGWTDLLYIYGHNSVPNKTLAEYTDNEWSSYLMELKENSCAAKFADNIKQNS